MSILNQMEEACHEMEAMLARAQLENAPDEVVSKMGFSFRAARTYLGVRQKVTEDFASTTEAERTAKGRRLTSEQWEAWMQNDLDAVLRCLRLVREWNDEWRNLHSDASRTLTARLDETMWDRFTERARRAVFQAQREATSLNAGAVGAEHLFLGLLNDSDSVACRVLRELGVSLDALHSEVLARVQPRSTPSPEELRLTPRCQHVIECAYEAARELNCNYIGTEHLLLGTLKSEGSLGALVMHDAGIEYTAAVEQFERVRAAMEQAPPAGTEPDSRTG